MAWFKVVEKESKLRREKGLERKRWPSPGREKMLFSPRWKGRRTGCLRKLLGLQVALISCQEAFLTKTYRTEEKMEETEAFRGQVTCSQYRSREQQSQDSNPDPHGTKISALNSTCPGKRIEVA